MSGLRFWTGNSVTKLDSNQIFVYDSNPQGMHGVGSGSQARSILPLQRLDRHLA